eukprot:14495560-Alexandrium_andersonii.AAC.1
MRGWHLASGNAYRLLADPVGPDEIVAAPLRLRCLRHAPGPPAASDSVPALSQSGSSVAASS